MLDDSGGALKGKNCHYRRDEHIRPHGGGPGNATNNIVINIYRTGFLNENISAAATIGVLWLLILLVFTYFYIRIMEGNTGTR